MDLLPTTKLASLIFLYYQCINTHPIIDTNIDTFPSGQPFRHKSES